MADLGPVPVRGFDWLPRRGLQGGCVSSAAGPLRGGDRQLRLLSLGSCPRDVVGLEAGAGGGCVLSVHLSCVGATRQGWQPLACPADFVPHLCRSDRV